MRPRGHGPAVPPATAVQAACIRPLWLLQGTRNQGSCLLAGALPRPGRSSWLLPHPPPLSLLVSCSYEVVLLDGTHLQMTAAALLGRIYVLGASAPEALWRECGPALQEVARSFRLRYRV